MNGWNSPRRPRPISPGKVRVIVGPLGTGKTYTAVHDLLGDVACGRVVLTNFRVQVPDPVRWGRLEVSAADAGAVRQIGTWEEFLEAEDCHVVLDEGHLWAPSYDPRALSGAVRYKLCHLRKDGATVTLVTQHEDRLAKMLRDLATEVLRVRVRRRFPSLSFLVRHFEPELARRQASKPLHVRTLKFDPVVAGCYRTLEAAGFPALVDPFEIGVVEELARRRNSGESLTGTVAAVGAELADGSSDRAVRWLAIGDEVRLSKGFRSGGNSPRSLSRVRSAS